MLVDKAEAYGSSTYIKATRAASVIAFYPVAGKM